MKKLLLIGLIIGIPGLLQATGLHIGMTGAVKAQVKELNDKVYAKKYTAGTLVITSVKQSIGGTSYPLVSQNGYAKAGPAFAGSFTVNPAVSYGHIASGEPDYIKATLEKISCQTESGKRVDAWTGSKELYMDGSGTVDTSGISLTLPSGNITSVILTFATAAKIKGTLTASFATSGTPVAETLYTKNAYSYDALTHAGGGANFTPFETGPAEETSVSLGADHDFTEITVPVIHGDTAASATLTILVDLNRMLRFYDGLSNAPSPADPTNKAYFFCHTLFTHSVAAFIGTAGTIQGYKTEYASYDAGQEIGARTPDGVLGWMTLIFDAQGNFLSGILMGDNDNALTVAKGNITSYSDTALHYEIDDPNGHTNKFTVNGFTKQTTINSASPVATWSETDYLGTAGLHGETIFTLLFQR
jgi:hypothetical protein